MRDKYPLPITEAEVLEAAMELNFQFFADLIQYPQPIDAAARNAAAEILLKFLVGEWSSKRGRQKAQTFGMYIKIADRVSELKDEKGGVNFAVYQTAQDIFERKPPFHNLTQRWKKPPSRTVWTAWEIRCERDKQAAKIMNKVAQLRASDGLSDEEKELLAQKALAEGIAFLNKETNRRLKRKR
jgi:hypothetical protein